jgi:excisionase family DNA binding protein
MENPDEKLLWTMDQVADQFGVCTKTVSRLITNGELPIVRIGRNIRITSKAVHHFLERREAYNSTGLESAVRNPTGERLCRIETPNDVKMAVSTPALSTKSASLSMEKEYNELLRLQP